MSLQQIINEWLTNRNIEPQAALIVGCSGGPDSMALLHLLHQSGRIPVAAHVNYQKREESRQEEQLVREFCEQRGIEYLFKKMNPEEAKGNFQNWAREVRYEFFHELRKEEDAAMIVTAHHLNDHLETLVLQLFRGTHPSGWQGIPEVSGFIGRPLRNTPKTAIDSYLAEHNLPYAVDSSNLESGYARNFIRNEMVSELDRLFPGWPQNLARLPEYAQEINELSTMTLESVLTKAGNLEREAFFRLPEHARRSVFSAWLNRHGIRGEVARTRYERLDELQKLQTGRRLQLNDEFFIEVDRKELVLTKAPVKCAYWSEFLTEDRLQNGWKSEMFEFRKAGPVPFGDENLQLNWDRLRFPVTLRTWRPGDAIQPLGMRGRKNVSDVLTDEKISSVEKSAALVLQGFDQTIYAIIFPPSHKRTGVLAEPVRCDESTRTVLLITKLN